MFIYHSHTGGLYMDERELTDDQLFCDICFASDDSIGEAETANDARRLLKDAEYYDLYGKDYCEKFIAEEFG